MSRILVLGFSPLPFENSRRLHAPGIRTWQMARPLAEDGHEILLICCRYDAGYEADVPDLLEIDSPAGRIRCLLVRDSLFNDNFQMQEIHDGFRPDGVVAATVIPSAVAVKLDTEAPIWADLFGHFMAEAQAKASVYDDDDIVVRYFGIERSILLRADAFSTVSHAQELATVGELGLTGRLNSLTTGYRFTHEIPCAMEEEPFPESGPTVRGTVAGDEDFVILWSGGYNTWADVDTLFLALEESMSRNERIRYVSIGGELTGQDELTYPRFREMVEQSPHRNRYCFRGWVPTEQVPAYYADADVGVNVDKDIYEVRLGSKNRILDWMRAGLPPLCSRVCELSRTLEAAGVGYTYPPGDAGALAEAILRLAASRDEVGAMRPRVRQYALEHFTFGVTTRPVRAWAEHPVRAPDRGRVVQIGQGWYDRYIELMKQKDRVILDLEATRLEKEGIIRIQEERIKQLEDEIRALAEFREEVLANRWYQRSLRVQGWISRLRRT